MKNLKHLFTKVCVLFMACCFLSGTSVYADQFEYKFSGTWDSIDATWPGGPNYVITIIADNGGSSPANQLYLVTDVISVTVVSGAFSSGGPTGLALSGGTISTFPTNAAGQWVLQGSGFNRTWNLYSGNGNERLRMTDKVFQWILPSGNDKTFDFGLDPAPHISSPGTPAGGLPDGDGDGVDDGADLCPGTASGDPVDADGCSADQRDDDGDGVLGANDLCSDTVIPESVPSVRLGTNRWALVDGDFDFDTTAPRGRGPNRSYNTTDTGGCSCEQIIAEQGLGKGHTKFGCSISAMDDWLAIVAGLPKSAADLDEDVIETAIPDGYALEQNYPNPFNPTTEISFGIPEAGEVKLAIYNLSGQLVRTLVSGQLSAGNHKVTWNATDDKGLRVATGIYLYVLKSGSVTIQKKLTLMK